MKVTLILARDNGDIVVQLMGDAFRRLHYDPLVSIIEEGGHRALVEFDYKPHVVPREKPPTAWTKLPADAAPRSEE